MISTIAFGGGCHWCTEAVFQSLKGVNKVQQGWIASSGMQNSFSEAVIIMFDTEVISLEILTEIHLRTHKSTVQHSMREKYRSAIYFYDENQKASVTRILQEIQQTFEEEIITQVLPFADFKPSREEITNYYYSNPEKPFCKQFIDPKLKLLLSEFAAFTDAEKLKHLDS